MASYESREESKIRYIHEATRITVPILPPRYPHPTTSLPFQKAEEAGGGSLPTQRRKNVAVKHQDHQFTGLLKALQVKCTTRKKSSHNRNCIIDRGWALGTVVE